MAKSDSSSSSSSGGKSSSSSSSSSSKSSSSSSSSKSSSSSSKSSTSSSKSSTSSSKSSGGGFFDSIGKGLSAIGKGISDALGGNSSSRGGDNSSSSGKSNASAAKDAAVEKETPQAKAANIKDKDLASPTATPSKAGYKGNAGVIAGTLSKAGLTDVQVAGVMGRLQQESSLNPNARNKNDAGPGLDSYGIGQWNRDRLDNLGGYAKALGKDKSDLATQAGFVAHEMFGSKDSRVSGKYGAGSESYAGKQLSKATTIQESAKAAMHYERPQGYTRSNPTAGHGFSNTVSYANNFAKGAGLDTSIAGKPTVDSMTTSAVAYRDPMVSVQKATSPISGIDKYGSAVAKMASGDVIGGALDAIGKLGQDAGVLEADKTSTSSKRSGFAGIIENFKNDNTGQALAGIASGLSNPLGFGLASFADLAINGGIEGNTAVAGRYDGNGSKEGGGLGDSGDPRLQGYLAGLTPVQEIAQIQPVAPTPVTQVAQTRKPFQWSKL